MYILRFKPFILLNILLLSILIVEGCKDDATTQPQVQKPVIVSFTANPTSVPAGGDSVTFSWNVTDATELSISPGVGTVTPVDSGSIKVFVSSPASYTLTATNAGGNTTSSVQIVVQQTISVNGVLKDIDGEPISGKVVMIKGKAPTSTSADGSFSFSNVTSPYEIQVILSTEKVALIYQGLTRSDPQLLYIVSTTTSKSATINGNVPIAPGKKTIVFFVSDTKSWWTTADQTTGMYSFTPDWKGSMTTCQGQLQVLRWTQNANGLPILYDAYGTKNLTISDGGTFDGNDFLEIDFTDPAEQNISGTITRPTSSYNINFKELSINFGASIYICNESGGALSDNFSYMVPSITGATFEVRVNATLSAVPTSRNSSYMKKNITAGTSGINIELAAAPQLSLPVHNGIDVDTTTSFYWTQGGGTGVNLIQLFPGGANPVFFIFTAENNTTIPNLAPQALGLPSGEIYSWTVSRYLPISSINDAASEFFIPLINGQSGDNGRAESEMFNFTTK